MPPLVKQIVGAIRDTAMRRWTSAQRLRADTRVRLTRQRARRQTMARSMRQTLQQGRSTALASLRSTLGPGLLPPLLWEASPSQDRTAGNDRLRADVLRVVQDHAEGITAVDVGNELGIDWRRVLDVGRTLAEGGLVDQVEHAFFPVRKAGARW
jgi:hypothetical protein